MALVDLSFKLYIDSGLTTPFSGLYQLIHKSDLSSNPQDFQLWLGSTVVGRTLETEINPGVDNITITPTETLDEWVTVTAYVAGYMVEPTVQNGFRYQCTTAGTTGASEPTWPTGAIGSTVVDGTVIWTLVSATHETTEIKLATTAAGLDAATAGAALSLGTSIASESANAVEINIRRTNAVTDVGTNTGYPELAISINSVIETA